MALESPTAELNQSSYGSSGSGPAGPAREDLSWPMVDRRSGTDRRVRRTRWFDSLLGHRRRHRGRRRGESENIYVDLYHSRDLVLVAVVFLLNVADAILTLWHLDEGGSEENPLMASLIGESPGLFLLEKTLIVAICLAVVVVHKNFTIARRGAYVLLTFYGALAFLHMVV